MSKPSKVLVDIPDDAQNETDVVLQEESAISGESNKTPVEENTEISVADAKSHPDVEKQTEPLGMDLYYTFDPKKVPRRVLLYYIPVFILPMIVKIVDLSIPVDNVILVNIKSLMAYFVFVADSAVLKRKLLKYKTPWKITIGWMVSFTVVAGLTVTVTCEFIEDGICDIVVYALTAVFLAIYLFGYYFTAFPKVYRRSTPNFRRTYLLILAIYGFFLATFGTLTLFQWVYESVDDSTRLVLGLLFPLQEWIQKYYVKKLTLKVTADPQISLITTLWITQSLTVFFLSRIVPLAESFESFEILIVVILARLVPFFGIHFVKSTEYYYKKYGVKEVQLPNSEIVGSGTVSARAHWRAYLLRVSVACGFDYLNECLAIFFFFPWYGWRTYVVPIASDPNYVQLYAALVYVGVVLVVGTAVSLWLNYCYKQLIPPHHWLLPVIIKNNLLLFLLHVTFGMAVGFMGF